MLIKLSGGIFAGFCWKLQKKLSFLLCQSFMRAWTASEVSSFFSPHIGAHYLGVITLTSDGSCTSYTKFQISIDFLTTLRLGPRSIFMSARRGSLYVGWGRRETVQGFLLCCRSLKCVLLTNRIIKNWLLFPVYTALLLVYPVWPSESATFSSQSFRQLSVEVPAGSTWSKDSSLFWATAAECFVVLSDPSAVYCLSVRLSFSWAGTEEIQMWANFSLFSERHI